MLHCKLLVVLATGAHTKGWEFKLTPTLNIKILLVTYLNDTSDCAASWMMDPSHI